MIDYIDLWTISLISFFHEEIAQDTRECLVKAEEVVLVEVDVGLALASRLDLFVIDEETMYRALVVFPCHYSISQNLRSWKSSSDWQSYAA